MAQLLVTGPGPEAGARQAAQETQQDRVKAVEHHGCQWLPFDSSIDLHGENFFPHHCNSLTFLAVMWPEGQRLLAASTQQNDLNFPCNLQGINFES